MKLCLQCDNTAVLKKKKDGGAQDAEVYVSFICMDLKYPGLVTLVLQIQNRQMSRLDRL